MNTHTLKWSREGLGNTAISGLYSANIRAVPILRVSMTDQATADTKEYSWCNPPSTDFERTTTPSPSRWRKCDGLAKTTSVFGGPGTPGPKLLCGLPRL